MPRPSPSPSSKLHILLPDPSTGRRFFRLEISSSFRLTDPNSKASVYSETSQACIRRPSLACCLRPIQGGGRSVDRETTIKDGILAMNLLKSCVGTDILAYVSQVHDVVLPETLVDHETLTFDQIKSSDIRCPNPEYEERMIAAIDAVSTRHDFIGGTVTCIVRNYPLCRGSRAFREIAAALAKVVMAIPATRGFEIGSGFTGTLMTGTEYIDESGQSGGTQGGIIKMRVAVKPRIPISKITVARDKPKVVFPMLKVHYFCSVPGAADDVERKIAQELLRILITEGGKCLMSPRENATSHEPLESPESAKA